jgi:hypothetical protein
MGTNYYATKKLSQQGKDDIIKAITLDKISLARDMMPYKKHIGKSSSGWAFLFNHNDWEDFTNVEEMWKWLMQCEIEDEYGQPFSFYEFKNMVDNKNDLVGRFNKSDWYIHKDGFAFSTSTDFS